MATLSFDFDGTLSRTDVQEFVQQLKNDGHRILIITNRHREKSNRDLYEVADRLKIARHNIWFCEMLGKHRFIRPGMHLVLHADDDWLDCELVESECEVPCVKMFGNPGWREEILTKIKFSDPIKRVIIAGSRNFNDYGKLKFECDRLTLEWPMMEVVSGTARGADTLGEQWAKEKGIPIKQFPADWDTHGKSAGYLRNAEMAKYANVLIAFWDGESKGTKHMIDLARANHLRRAIVEI